MRSVYDNTKVAGQVAIFSTSVSVIATGPSVDTKGYNSAALRVYIGTVGAGLSVLNGSSLTAIIQESNDDGVADAYATANDNTGAALGFTGTQATTTAVISDARIEGLGLSNRKRYLRVKLTANQGGPTGTIANAFTAIAVIELGRSYTKPTSTATSNT